MSHLQTYLDFDSSAEDATGDGWRVVHFDTDDTSNDGNPVQTTTFHATIDAALGAIEDLFQADGGVDAYFTAKAQADYLAANQTAVDAALAAQRTGESLTP